MKLYSVEYLGFTAMDKRFSRPMLPWVIAEIRRRGTSEKVRVSVYFVIGCYEQSSNTAVLFSACIHTYGARVCHSETSVVFPQCLLPHMIVY